jgi:hypothetical protein
MSYAIYLPYFFPVKKKEVRLTGARLFSAKDLEQDKKNITDSSYRLNTN